MKKKACFVCLKNCVRLHGDEDDDPEEEITPTGSSGPTPKETIVVIEPGPKEDGPVELHPAFLKKMSTEHIMTSALQMPASFVKSFGARIGTTVTLEGPGNEKWEVMMGPSKEKHTLEFRDGWHKFVVDHILQIGDHLAFTLTAESHFKVVVFDESGSQKLSATDAVNSPPTLQKEVDQGGPSVPFRGKPSARPKQKVRRRIRTDGAVPPVKAPAVHSSESELRNSDNTPEKENKSKEAASDDDEEEEPDPDDDSHLPLLPPHSIMDGHVISQRRPVTQAERDRALVAAKALPVTNPKLTVVMSKGYVYRGFWMALSRPFAKAHMPKETREVTLLNVAGHKWMVKWLHKEVGSGFSGGWRGFALDHRLEEGDVCVFEILDQKNYVFLVHIFRVVGGPKEDTGDYSPAPGRSRNADWVQTPSGFKRKGEADRHAAGPSSPMKSFNTPTPGKHKAPLRCSKVEDYTAMPSSSKRGPLLPAAKVVRSPDFVADETLDYCQKAKKAKASPTTSCEVYAEYASFVTPSPGVGVGADLNVRPLLAKQSAAEKREDDLLKLGRELVHTTKSASEPSSSSSSEEMQIAPPSCNAISSIQDKDSHLPETCVCVPENHVSVM